MELTRTWIDDAGADGVRVCGEVTYDDRPGHPETYWFDFPRQCASEITTTGNPWAVALLPLAATLGEPLRLRIPIDSVLLANLTRLLGVWHSWYRGLSVVPIITDVDVAAPSAEAARTVAFFSGGIDSFYTLLRARDVPGERQIDDLLSIWGFDVPLANQEAFIQMRVVLESVANAAGKQLIAAATNLRTTRWAAAEWGRLSHACGLASVALMLERRWSRVLIASSYTYAHLHPWGSHPLTDSLLSTARTVVVHDGADADRVAKTRAVAESTLAMRSLRVCWRSRSDRNCGTCEKCYRTMTTLWLLGALERCATFPPGSFDPARIDRIYCRTGGAVIFMLEIRELAIATGRRDVARAIDRALARSRRLVRAEKALASLGAAVESHSVLQPSKWLLDRVEWRLFRRALR